MCSVPDRCGSGTCYGHFGKIHPLDRRHGSQINYHAVNRLRDPYAAIKKLAMIKVAPPRNPEQFTPFSIRNILESSFSKRSEKSDRQKRDLCNKVNSFCHIHSPAKHGRHSLDHDRQCLQPGTGTRIVRPWDRVPSSNSSHQTWDSVSTTSPSPGKWSSCSSRSETDVEDEDIIVDVVDDSPDTVPVSPLDALVQMSQDTFKGLNDGDEDGRRSSGDSMFGKAQTQKKKRKTRTAFTNQQIYELEKRFLYQKYVTPADRDEISQKLGLTSAQVITWFQNRRAKYKRDLEEMKNDVVATKEKVETAWSENDREEETVETTGTGGGGNITNADKCPENESSVQTSDGNSSDTDDRSENECDATEHQ